MTDLYNVSSQIEVAKHFILNLSDTENNMRRYDGKDIVIPKKIIRLTKIGDSYCWDLLWIREDLSANARSRSSSETRSILWIRIKIDASGLFCSIASRMWRARWVVPENARVGAGRHRRPKGVLAERESQPRL